MDNRREERERLIRNINAAENNLRILEDRLNDDRYDKYDKADFKHQIEYTKAYIREHEYYLNMLG